MAAKPTPAVVGASPGHHHHLPTKLQSKMWCVRFWLAVLEMSELFCLFAGGVCPFFTPVELHHTAVVRRGQEAFYRSASASKHLHNDLANLLDDLLKAIKALDGKKLPIALEMETRFQHACRKRQHNRAKALCFVAGVQHLPLVWEAKRAVLLRLQRSCTGSLEWWQLWKGLAMKW